MARTSHSHPLQIAELPVRDGEGMVGVTFCPGKHQADALTGAWRRDLQLDLDAVRNWGAEIVMSLVTAEELSELNVATLGTEVEARAMRWFHLPILDVSVPSPEWETWWAANRPAVHEVLDRGQHVLVHCKGGLGRAGLTAARLLVERGEQPSDAIRAVRAVRPGAIETTAQERYILRLTPGMSA